MTDVDNAKHSKPKYKLVVPDGGWGYAIMIAVILIFSSTITPMNGFGIVYNQFLGNLGDVTSASAITNSVFNTALCFTGLAANQLLQKLSYRKVGLIGVVIYFVGSFGIIFANSLIQLVITFGILQGIGFGLMMPTIWTAFNAYFDVRQNFVMSIAQAFIGIGGIFVPAIFRYFMDTFGFRGTVAILCALSLHTLPAMVSLQPVKWHLRKRRLSHSEIQKEQENSIEDEPLLKPKEKTDQLLKKELINVSIDKGTTTESSQNVNKQNNVDSYWKMLVKSLDLELFKDPVYVNIICGISLSITSDLAFLPLYPTLLVGNGFSGSEITIIMTTYFMADLVSRLCMFLLNTVVRVKNRYIYLISALFSGIFRIVFTMNNSFWWITCVSAILGFLRSPIQSILSLVIAEAYGHRFVTAFSLYMVICGCVALSVGFLAATIKNYTKDDVMVVHLYTVAYLLCGIPWTIEVIYFKFFKRKASSTTQ